MALDEATRADLGEAIPAHVVEAAEAAGVGGASEAAEAGEAQKATEATGAEAADASSCAASSPPPSGSSRPPRLFRGPIPLLPIPLLQQLLEVRLPLT